MTDDCFLLLFNAHHEPIEWTLPKLWGERWEMILDTSGAPQDGDALESGRVLPVAGRSVVVLRRQE